MPSNTPLRLLKTQFACHDVILTDSGTAALHLRLLAESYDRVLRDRANVPSPQAPLWIESLRAVGIDARESISHIIPEYHGNPSVIPRLGRVSKMVVSVPIFPAMTVDEGATVTAALRTDPR
jgi:dTDP-4-amino-4,6-dideoxygalactose transaminase